MRRITRENGDEFLVAPSGVVARVLPLPSPARDADAECVRLRFDPGVHATGADPVLGMRDPFRTLRSSGAPRAAAR